MSEPKEVQDEAFRLSRRLLKENDWLLKQAGQKIKAGNDTLEIVAEHISPDDEPSEEVRDDNASA